MKKATAAIVSKFYQRPQRFSSRKKLHARVGLVKIGFYEIRARRLQAGLIQNLNSEKKPGSLEDTIWPFTRFFY